jgi:hypothetical protein
MVRPGAGDCDFLADPKLHADQTAVFWRVEDCASVVILEAARPQLPATTIALRDLPKDVLRRDAADGAHLLIREGTLAHQLMLIGRVKTSAPLAALVPLDDTLPQRTEATQRFWRFAAHSRPPPEPRPLRRRDRLIAALRALDGHLSGASYRMIGDVLFERERVEAETWKTSSLRGAVIRLVHTGVAMMRRDYRTLLRPRQTD